MSFRRNRHRVEYVAWKGEDVQPSAGHITVYHWTKGTPRDPNRPAPGETWVKADIYGLDAQPLLLGLLADSLDQLKTRVDEELRLL